MKADAANAKDESCFWRGRRFLGVEVSAVLRDTSKPVLRQPRHKGWNVAEKQRKALGCRGTSLVHGTRVRWSSYIPHCRIKTSRKREKSAKEIQSAVHEPSQILCLEIVGLLVRQVPVSIHPFLYIHRALFTSTLKGLRALNLNFLYFYHQVRMNSSGANNRLPTSLSRRPGVLPCLWKTAIMCRDGLFSCQSYIKKTLNFVFPRQKDLLEMQG